MCVCVYTCIHVCMCIKNVCRMYAGCMFVWCDWHVYVRGVFFMCVCVYLCTFISKRVQNPVTETAE